MSHEQSVRLPALQDAVTAWTTPALVTAYINAVSLVPGGQWQRSILIKTFDIED
jgi:hypothetical protein